MSLITRINALASALGADVKALSRQSGSTLTGNTTFTASDNRKYLKLSGSGTDYSLSFDTPSNLGDGWWCTVENTDAALNGGWWHILSVCDGVSLSSINGYSESFSVHPHEIREFYVSGGALYSRVIRPFAMEYGYSISFKMPSGYAQFANAYAWGGGGSGAKSGTTAGAGGGGGGACTPLIALCPNSGTTITATVAASVAGPTATGSNGTVGNTSTVAWDAVAISAFGGGGGYGITTAGAGGGGGGALSAGTTPAANNLNTPGGSPSIVGTSVGTAGSGSGLGGSHGPSSSNINRGDAAWGGAGGGNGPTTGSPLAGGSTVFGGPGGGGVSGAGTTSAGGTQQLTGATGGAGGNATSGEDGTGYGAGGGGTRTGATAGDGAGGAVRISAI